MRIKVANYALNDLFYALECSGIDEVTCTMEDGNLLIVYDSKYFKRKKYKKEKSYFSSIVESIENS